ncbi:MAG: Hint domain-containing protein [Gemmobacter sp.]|jgi:hypothetical protein|nr:Hint domain-containing protein [Gemmobacter sp.]
MGTGARGTFVISWSQTETDGIAGASSDALGVGVTWRWTGAPLRVDGPQSVLLLEGASGEAELRRRAARMVRRLIGMSLGRRAPAGPEDDGVPDDEPEQGFVVTDGRNTYPVTLIEVAETGTRLAMFLGAPPPEGRDLWVVRVVIDRTPGGGARRAGGVICFTPDTFIATPRGPRPILSLHPGERILTRDNGPQQILWMGSCRMTGARLHAMPHLRPIRFRSGALGAGQPEGDLLVSPQHRMLVRGPAARLLFNSDEVLVTAGDLLDNRRVVIDHALREVTYIHLLLERHEIIFANGLEAESFHPANAALDSIDPVQRAALLALLPGIEAQPANYGEHARRNLSASEAAILRHDFAA